MQANSPPWSRSGLTSGDGAEGQTAGTVQTRGAEAATLIPSWEKVMINK